MATNEKIIFDLKVDMTKALEQQQTLKKSIEEIRRAQKENADKTSAEYITNEATLKNLNNQLLNNSKILQASAQNATDEAGAYRKLSDAYLYQSAKAKDLAVAYGANDERTKTATASAKAMSDQLKDVEKSVGQANRNVGNYTESLNTLAPSLGGTVTGLLNMGKALLALLANPIGLVIGAIAAAFYGLYTVLKNFDPVLDMIEQGFSMVSGAFTALKENVLAVITGQKSLKEAISGVGGEMSKAAKEAKALKDAQQNLDDLQKISAVNQEKYKNQIAELILQSKNRTLTEKQRIALIDEALKIEDKAFKEKKAMADEEVRIAQMLIANGRGLTAQELSNLKTKGIAYAIELSQKKQISDEEIKLLQGALIKQQQIEGESIAMREVAMNKRDKLIQDSQDKQDKRTEAQQKKDAQILATRMQDEKDEADFIIKTDEAILKIKERQSADLLALKEEALKQDEKIAELELEAEQIALDNQYNLAKGDVDRQLQLTYDMIEAKRVAEVGAADGNAMLISAINEKYRQQDIEATKEAQAAKQEAFMNYANKAQDIAGSLSSVVNSYGQSELNLYEKNNKGKAGFEEEFAKKKAKLARETAIREKSLAVINTTINTAVAVMKAAPIIPLQIATGIAGAAAIAAILATPIPGGGGGASTPSTPIPSGGGSSIPQASVAGGIVARSTNPSQAAQVAQGVGSALQANPMQPVLVTNDLTIAQNQKVELKTNNSL